VADAERFVQAYFSVVAEMPLQIYCCLAFAPRKSIVRRTFEHAISKWISNLPKVEQNWDACLLTLEGHSSCVSSVVFSHDSKKVASGSDDKTIRIWDAETGECEETVPLDDYAHVLSFATDRRGIITDRGVFVLSGGSQTHAKPAMLRQSLEAPILTGTDGTWITVAKTVMLWLPPECRNGEVAVSGSTVVIGCRSGRVLVLGISMAEVEQ
jgi:WD40 repeat protein